MSRIIDVLAGLAFAACSTSGTGVAEVSEAEVGAERGELATRTVTFEWASEGSSPTSGTISANVPGHDAFRGHYVQAHSQSRATSPESMRGDYGVPPSERWQPEGGPSRLDHYSHQLVAQLRNHDDERMLCTFVLLRPDEGIAGGGVGECQLSDGTQITNARLQSD